MEIDIYKIQTEFNKELAYSIMGRYFSFTCGIISFILAYIVAFELFYILVSVLSGLLMLFSFKQHRRLNYIKSKEITTKSLLVSIRKLREHNSKSYKYDILISWFWIITTCITLIKVFFGSSLFKTFSLITLIVSFSVITSIVFYFSYNSRKKWERNLNNLETQLEV